MTKTMKTLTLAVLGVMLMSAASLLRAEDTKWQKNHPRREQVNKRTKNQNKRIRQGVKSGKLTKDQAQQLHKEDRQIRQEERDMAAQNGGHITKQEQKTLNQQENAVSKQIYDEKHPAPAGGTTPAPTPAQ